MNRLPEARRAFETAARYDADNPNLRLDLGNVCAGLQDFKAARANFEEAIRLSPSLLSARIGLCKANLGLGRRDEASRSYQAARHLDPGNDAGVSLAFGNICMSLKMFDEARAHFESATRLAPSALPARIGLSHANLLLGRRDEAVRAFEAARRLNPNHPRVRQLAQLLERGRP